MGIFVPSYIYLMYGKQDAKGKLLMAIFSPLIGVVLEVMVVGRSSGYGA